MGRKKYKLKGKVKNGYLQEVRNPYGKRPRVEIFQGGKPGFSARYYKSKRVIKGTSRNAEAFAIKLAKKGHKKVTFLT